MGTASVEPEPLQRQGTRTPVKRCVGCGQYKPATPDFFYRQPRPREDLDPRCKGCHKEATRRRRADAAKPLCACGCGGHVGSARSRFIRGHGRASYESGPLPACRECGRVATRRYGLNGYEPDTNTYLCRFCAADARRRWCARCGAELFRKTRGTLCTRCLGRDRAPYLQRIAVGLDARAAPDELLSAQRRHIRDVVAASGGHGKLLAVANNARARKGLSGNGRFRLTVWKMIRASRRGTLMLCPLCRRWKYRPPARRDRPGFHATCWQQVALSTVAQRLPARRHGERGPGAAEAARRFEWLLRHFLLRESLRTIAGTAGYAGDGPIRRGLDDFIDRLPDHWRDVFRNQGGGRFLDDALPVDRLRKWRSRRAKGVRSKD